MTFKLEHMYASHGPDLLPVDDPRFGCDEGSQQCLDAALPTPEGGVVGL